MAVTMTSIRLDTHLADEAARILGVKSRQNWLDSGELLSQMHQDRGFASEKLRNLHFDVLIALTARSHGARLVTSDRSDFELIASYKAAKALSLEIW